MKTLKTKQIPGLYEIRGARAVDGDTIEAVICLPFKCMMMKRIRLAGWWAPELVGPNSSNGFLAKQKLQAFLDSNLLFMFSRGEREDKYGRVIATLHDGKAPVQPADVLGMFALTEIQHKKEHDDLKRWRASQPPMLLSLGESPLCQEGHDWDASRGYSVCKRCGVDSR